MCDVPGFLKIRTSSCALRRYEPMPPLFLTQHARFLLGIEVVRSKERGEPNTEAAEAITRYSRDGGLLMGWIPGKPSGANVIRLMPPFTLTKADADLALRIFEDAVHRAGRL